VNLLFAGGDENDAAPAIDWVKRMRS